MGTEVIDTVLATDLEARTSSDGMCCNFVVEPKVGVDDR